MSVPSSLRQSVATRDRGRCAYCLTTEENCGLNMHVDHVVPEVAGGPTILENLCLACFACNTYKGAQQTGADPKTKKTVALFHPIRQRWADHFTWSEDQTLTLGLSPSGRATVVALQMNNPTVVDGMDDRSVALLARRQESFRFVE